MEKKGFGGIFGKLAQMAMTPEYLAELQKKQTTPEVVQEVSQPVQSSPARKVVVQPSVPINSSTVFASSAGAGGQSYAPTPSFATPTVVTPEMTQEAVQKIYDFLENINEPGVDFLEFWNAVEAMDGGITPANIKNAFVAIKMVSGGTVSKSSLISTGEGYVQKVNYAIETNISNLEEEKARTQEQLNQERQTLETEIASLEKEIAQKQELINKKRVEVGQIGQKHLPKMQANDLKIVSGKTALSMVINEMNQFISQIQTVIAE
ncbi:MAG: hypothetical protein LBG52_06720 [Candidatus Peribacteria bacterium]|jgi:gas vesicle protein|nr:hypothetical protein [Candidatus Peribacteria bacterium]